MNGLIKIRLTGLLFLLCSTTLFAQNYNYIWDRTYGGDSRDWNSSVSINAAGEVFLIGDSQSDISGNKSVSICNSQAPNSDLWLMKVFASGNGSIIWQRGYGGDLDDRAPVLYHLNDGSGEMLIGSYSTSDIACDKTGANRDTVAPFTSDYWICKIDSTGTLLWEKTIGGNNYDDYTKLTGFSNGDILVSGESNSPVGYDKTVPNYSISNDIWTLKLDASGNILWDNVFGGDGGEFLASVIANPDGTFLLAGSTNSGISGDVSEPGQGNYDYWMIKVDSSGNKIWDKRFGGSGPDRCNHAIRTSDGGYVLCGFTVSPQGGDVTQAPKGIQDYWVVRTDDAGNKLWDKRFGGTGGSFGSYVQEALYSGFWIAGYSNSGVASDVSEPSYGGSDYWILKINNSGDKIWDKRFGGSGDEFNTAISELADSTLLVFGYSDSGSSSVKNSPSYGWFDNYLVKFTYTDSTTSLINHPDIASNFSIYPNPASDIINVRFDSRTGKYDTYKLTLTDMVGKEVYQMSQISFENQSVITFNTSTFSRGIYLLNIENQSGITKSEIISINR